MTDKPSPAAKALMKRAKAARNFPENTCPGSRHVQMAAESLIKTGQYFMFEEEPEHIAGSMLSVVESLFKARTALLAIRPNEEGGGWWWETPTMHPTAGGA